MRNTSSWRQNLTPSLRPDWSQSVTGLNIPTFCDIELGLYLLSELGPQSPARALWVLLTGYLFPGVEVQHWNDEHHRMLGNARYILSQFRSEYKWEQALKRYRQIDERLRGYQIDEKLETFSPQEVSICSNRQEIYAKALKHPLPHSTESVKWTTAGSYECSDGKYRVTVPIPDHLIFPPPSGHNLVGKTKKEPFIVPWSELIETAGWMDKQSSGKWEQRLSRVRLDLFGSDGKLARADTLTLDGLMHLIGMVSSGKSTLMDILAVWAAGKGLHVTIVVGDVIGALNRARLFAQFDIPVAPILGASNRIRHTNRLHRTLTAEEPLAQLAQEHIGFRWLSTACPVSELRRDVSKPFQMGKQPCLTLFPTTDSEEEEGETEQPRPYACALYSACPFHQAQRDLVAAKIWIATPASLVYTRVAKQLNPQQIRFFELVYRHSDLVIVDEADQVQVQLDTLFSPSQKLSGIGGDGWLSQVQQPVVQQLNQHGHRQLADPEVERWDKAHDVVQTMRSRLYGLVQSQQSALNQWIEKGDYFTDWLILDQLAIALSGASATTRDEHPSYRQLRQLFDEYLDDPLGDRTNHPLSELTSKYPLTNNEEAIREQLGEWIKRHKEPNVILTEQQLKDAVVQLEFAMLVAVLSDRLNQILRDWKQVEEPFQLAGQSSMLFQSPPRDYEALVPASAMGNVLAFQYVRSSNNGSGDLRFFKCTGVGRWLLLHLHDAFASDGIVGPDVLLLSGTSWAGTAPGYHVQVPVAGVLRSPEEELQAIATSSFEFSPFYDNKGNPITVSGATGDGRIQALKELVGKLAKPGGLGGPSVLEVERKKLPEGRQRILLLVGSYEQAKRVHEYLDTLRSDWQGQILHLVRDDDEFGTQWNSDEKGIQRGLVHEFAKTEAWILIAPLMAIERGHNILNQEDKAAIGAAYFLVRPHPRPDDISYAIHSINRWAVDRYSDTAWLTKNCPDGVLTLENIGNTFREGAYRRWLYLLRLPMIYSTLPDSEREAVTWNQLVSIWQVIGRLIRGGAPARVFFCDAAFARRTAFQDEPGDEPLSSLLVSIKQVLRPYFNPDSGIKPQERELVQALYGPFYQAVENIGGIADEL